MERLLDGKETTNGRNPILGEDRVANSPAKPEVARTYHGRTVPATRGNVNICRGFVATSLGNRQALAHAPRHTRAETKMIGRWRGILLLGAVLLVAGCNSDGVAPYDYDPSYNHSIDSDISATHDAGAP